MGNFNKKTFNDYLELTKPRILLLVLVTVTLGYYLGGQGVSDYTTLFFLLLGTALVCAGSAALNHYLEREFDSKMMRTKNRPIPAGRITPKNAMNFGLLLVLLGVFILYVRINILCAFLSLLTTFLYVLVYTPMKRTSWLNTTVGAIPGAMPTLGGWAAATGTLNFQAGILFLILFLWQHPHFYAIAWMFKEDYRLGGFKMLPCIEEDGRRTFRQIYWSSFILIPVSILPSIIGMSGLFYFCGAFILGVILLNVSLKFIISRSDLDAKRLLLATVYYLPVLLALIIVDAKF